MKAIRYTHPKTGKETIIPQVGAKIRKMPQTIAYLKTQGVMDAEIIEWNPKGQFVSPNEQRAAMVAIEGEQVAQRYCPECGATLINGLYCERCEG